MGKLLLFILVPLVFFAMFMLAMAPQAGQGISDGISMVAESGVLDAPVDDIPELLDYEGLPLTRHALDGHANEKWNALTIPTEMTWNCTPKRYACTENGDDFEVHYCRVNDGKSIGLIIGRTVKQIMTGFMAKTEYWEDRCNSRSISPSRTFLSLSA